MTASTSKSSNNDWHVASNRSDSRMFNKQQWSAISKELSLTDRELDVVRCLFDDQTESETAEELGISSHTVHTHMGRIFEKLGATSRCGAMLRVFSVVLKNRVVVPTRRSRRRKTPSRR